MKKIFIALTALFLPLAACAQDMPTIRIVYSGESASVTVPDTITDVTATINGATVTIVSDTEDREYCYNVSGSTTSGSLLIQGDYKLTLELDGVSISSAADYAIAVSCGKRIAVVLCDGTVNTLEDAAGGTQKAALYFTGHPEFEGSGTLNVTGNTAHAISAKEYLEVKKTTGTINILGAVKDGIHCGKGKKGNANNYFEMNGGTVTVTNVQGDCIDSDDYGCVKIKGGTLNLNVSTTKNAGIKCDSIFKMTDGVVNINITAENAQGVLCNYLGRFDGGEIVISNLGAGSKGIKLKCETDVTSTVTGGGMAEFYGTDIDAVLSGANMADSTRCMAISIDKDATVSAGKLNIQLAGEETKAYNVKGALTVSDEGEIHITGTQFQYDPALYEYDMSAYLVLKLDSVMVTDYANMQIGAFLGNECRGTADIVTIRDNTTYAYLRLGSNVTTGETLEVKVYDASNGITYTADEAIDFSSDSQQGSAGEPGVFTIHEPVLLGDANNDGNVSVSDLSTVVSYILNPESVSVFNKKAADANCDGNISVSDLSTIVSIILGTTK